MARPAADLPEAAAELQRLAVENQQIRLSPRPFAAIWPPLACRPKPNSERQDFGGRVRQDLLAG
jgi:hypothetical protein